MKWAYVHTKVISVVTMSETALPYQLLPFLASQGCNGVWLQLHSNLFFNFAVRPEYSNLIIAKWVSGKLGMKFGLVDVVMRHCTIGNCNGSSYLVDCLEEFEIWNWWLLIWQFEFLFCSIGWFTSLFTSRICFPLPIHQIEFPAVWVLQKNTSWTNIHICKDQHRCRNHGIGSLKQTSYQNAI